MFDRFMEEKMNFVFYNFIYVVVFDCDDFIRD